MLLFSLIIAIILIIILLTNTISATMCSINETEEVLKKALYNYLPDPEASKLNVTEIKDLLSFYLNSGNLTEVKCDIKATLSNTNYDVIVDRFSNLTKYITIPYCEDGTHYGKCSATKPLYCFAGRLVNRCRLCGCLIGQECQIDERAAFTINEGRWGKCVIQKKGNVTILDDLDGDGINETLTNTGVEGSGNISNTIIAVLTHRYNLSYYDITTDKLVDTGITDVRNMDISNNVIVISVYESAVGEDLNNDGDMGDRILEYYDINTGRLVNTGIIDISWFGATISNNVIAFVGDTLKYYNINTGNLVNTGLTVGGE